MFGNPWQQQAETLYRAADQLAAELAVHPALQPIQPVQVSDIFYESLYYLNLVCDNILADGLSGHRDFEARMAVTMQNVGSRVEALLLKRTGLSRQGPGYQQWERAFYTAMKERRAHYGEMDPRVVARAFGQVVLGTLGKRSDDSVIAEIARASLKVMRDAGLIKTTQRLVSIAK